MRKWNLRKKPSDSSQVELPSAPLPEDTRDKLIQVAKTLFSEKGFDGTTVKDIASAAGVNISLISYHFQGKEGLYRTCLEQFGKARLSATERVLQSPSSIEEFRIRLQMFIEEIISVHLEEPELSRILNRECEMDIPIVRDIFKNTFLQCRQTLVDFFKTAQTRGFLRKELQVDIIVGLFFGSIIHMAEKDKLNEIFFGCSIRNRKYREALIQQCMIFCLYGCSNQHTPLQIGAHYEGL
jgi:AcrR family transcriptional regulator